ncbi:hypothetical protein PG996_002812 [Apiospora saccharicola]|uniref:Uncharacterized protein n=1 Tax=Apiospora saccharicola TaxID=335842 RepID=A0ABR1WKL3_9PEZI
MNKALFEETSKTVRYGSVMKSGRLHEVHFAIWTSRSTWKRLEDQLPDTEKQGFLKALENENVKVPPGAEIACLRYRLILIARFRKTAHASPRDPLIHFACDWLSANSEHIKTSHIYPVETTAGPSDEPGTGAKGREPATQEDDGSNKKNTGEK